MSTRLTVKPTLVAPLQAECNYLHAYISAATYTSCPHFQRNVNVMRVVLLIQQHLSTIFKGCQRTLSCTVQ